MDFKILKEKALKLKEKAINMKDKALDYGAWKLASSGFTIDSKEELDKFIDKSGETIFKNKTTWVEKIYSHKVIIIFWDEKTDFFKNALYQLPVIITKSFSQNTLLKLAKTDIKDIDLSIYGIKEMPSIVVFENKKIYKVISWEENIIKLVKSFSLDINKAIEEL